MKRSKSGKDSEQFNTLLEQLMSKEGGYRGRPLAGICTFEEFARQMNTLVQLTSVEKIERVALLKDLYILANLKTAVERWTTTDRSEASEFRKYRTGLADVERLLSQAMQKVMDVVGIYPRLKDIDMLVSGEDIRSKVVQAGKTLAEAVEITGNKQKLLAAMINPQLRTDLERKLVQQEHLLVHSTLPLGEKTPAIDHWFIGEAASKPDKYRAQNGGKIKRYEKIIVQVFNVALDDKMRTEESIRIELRRQKKDGKPELF